MLSTCLAIIGGGNMARAIVMGLLRAEILPPECVAVAEIDPRKRIELADLGIATFADATSVIEWLHGSDTPARDGHVLLAVKPQAFASVADGISDLLTRSPRRVISIMAGVPSARISASLGGCPVIRAMPNLPAQVRQGATAVSIGEHARPGDEGFALHVFQSLGPLVVTVPESLLDAFTAVAGSGPAYLFYLAEAMQNAAVSLGFAPDQARLIVAQTLLGAASLLNASDVDPVSLRQSVTSRGGTTQAATEVMDASQVHDVLVKAITAARDRGRELSGG